MTTIFLLLGSNQGNRLDFLEQAISQIEKNIGSITKKSSVYESHAWGYKSDNNYMNQAVSVQTILSPEKVLAEIHSIEKLHGRIRNTNQYSDRTLDIDILLIDDFIINSPTLTVPHPHLHNRKFALFPLAELDHTIIHPVLKKSVQILLNECNDSTFIKKN